MDVTEVELLEGLEGAAREAREKLLALLRERGFEPEELRAAAAENRLALLLVEQVLGGRYTASEVEERTGTPAALILRIRRLSGLPQAGEADRVFSDADIASARSTRQFLDAGLGEAALVEITRVLGESMARLAATAAGACADAVLRPGDTEYEVAVRFAELAEDLMPTMTPVLNAAFSAHLRESVSRGMIGRAELDTGHLAGATQLAVCFADLVGFTRLGGDVEVQELGIVAGKLAELAVDVAQPPVRLIKTIGDAAMFASLDPAPLVEATLSLLDAAADAELPSLRAGIALGPTLQRAGDLFGHTVNLASRVTGAARPNSVLCTEEIHDATADSFAWSFAGRFRFKGVHDPVPLHRVRWLGDGDEQADDADTGTRGSRRRRADRPRRPGSS